MLIIAATGHRPDKLGGYSRHVSARLISFAMTQLERDRPDKVISGMALGWDQAVAAAAYCLGIPFIAAIPFVEQPDRWPPESQKIYHSILAEAETRHYCMVSTPSCNTIASNAMQKRNEWMVDNADRLLALWDGSWGGTFNCIQYAEKKHKPIDNVWGRWELDNIFR